MPDPIAHTSHDGTPLQTVEEHLENVAYLASSFVAPFCDPGWGRLAGRWHDLGKFSPEFQAKIRAGGGFDEFADEAAAQARVDHSTAGALAAVRAFGRSGGGAMVGDAIAAVVAGHHGGLPNIVGGLDARLAAKAHLLERALAGGAPAALLSAPRPLTPPCVRPSTDVQAALRDWELWVRFLYSALVDADSLDTEAFCSPEVAAERGGFDDIGTLTARLESHLTSLEGRPGRVAEARRAVQAAIAAKAAEPQGVFTLTVPTGGGKTLASLLFGLRHARAHGLDRVIVVPPFTSIIEQTAEVYRGVLGEANVVEHHSALDPKTESRRNALATDNWDAPVIVTTAVQFLETLFANRRSRCRKLHRVARSVVVIDEAQAIPAGYLAPILDVLQALVAGYGVTLVLSTATMPALLRRERFPLGFRTWEEIAPAPAALAESLRRVKVVWPTSLEASEPLDALARRVAAEPRALAIVHRKADARLLTEEVERIVGSDTTWHLSGNMCPEHRSQVLDRIRSALQGAGPVRVVATQLVEAGVDLDFPVVFRALAGIDALAQAAGRCNREGKASLGRLEVFLPPSRPPQGVPAAGAAVTRELLATDPVLDLFSPEVHQEYFQRLYSLQQLDASGVQACRSSRAFEDVADKFRVIEEASREVVVPWRRGAALIEELRRDGPSRSGLRTIQRFLVRCPGSVFRELEAAGALEDVSGAVTALRWTHRHLYSDRLGLTSGGAAPPDAEAFVV